MLGHCMQASRCVTLLTAALLLLLTGTIRGQDRRLSGQQEHGSPIVIGHQYALHSQVLNETRQLFIGLPENYDKSRGSYPVLYVLDGNEQLFLGVMGVTRILASQDRMPGTIVVAIPSIDRNHDLTPPTEDPANAPPRAGGADKFLKFLHDELIPYVNTRFRVTRHRTVIGDSFGGLFAVHTLVRQPDTFDSYVALSPSLWWNHEAPIANLEKFLSGPHTPAKHLVFTIANEPAQMRTPIDRLRKMLLKAPPPQFHWDFLEFPKETHNSSAFPALWAALRRLFADWPISDEDASAGIKGIEEAYRRRSVAYGVSPEVSAKGYFEFGYRLLGSGKPEVALEAFQRSAKRDPGYAYAFTGLGMAYEQLGRVDEAVESTQKAVELSKTHDPELAAYARGQLEHLKQLQDKAKKKQQPENR